MFTESKIFASDLRCLKKKDIYRNGSFSYVTKMQSNLNNRAVPCANLNYVKQANEYQNISGLIVSPKHIDFVDDSKFIILSEKPLETAFLIHEEISKLNNFQWSDFATEIHPTAKISSSAIIPMNNVKIGKNVVISDNVVVHERTLIGDESLIGSNSSIGCDAFQVFKHNNGRQKIIAQTGGVKINKNVEIQSNCTISRAIFGGFTEIGAETLIDSQVHIGHDCLIGKKVLIANQCSIAGRVTVSDNVYLGPNSTISNGIEIGENSKITLGSTVITKVPKNTTFTGFGAQEHSEWMRQRIMHLRKK